MSCTRVDSGGFGMFQQTAVERVTKMIQNVVTTFHFVHIMMGMTATGVNVKIMLITS